VTLGHLPNLSLMRRLAVVLVVLAMLAGCGDDEVAEPRGMIKGPFDAERAFSDLEAQVALGPRPSGSPAGAETAELIGERLREAGAEDVVIQRPWQNVVGTIPGRKPGVVVVGAHHDTKDDVPQPFVGANDGASGVAVLLELARTLPRPLPGPSVQLVAFDAEEARGDEDFLSDGLRGSRQYVELATRGGGQGTPSVDELRAMVLFDLVGDCDLQVPREELSDAGLYELFAEAAAHLDGDPAPFEGTASAVADDHVPFLQAGIPAVDLIDFTFGPGDSPGAWWHTPQDTLDKVCPESLDQVGEAALRAIPRIR
jgi:glutaminyl-peptide cyclotransferase